MRCYLYAAAALIAMMALPVSAQTQNQGGSAPVTSPSAQNSGTGIPGQSGTQSGPAPSSSGPAAANEDNRFVQQQDSAKIPGQPGGKSGEAAKSPQSPPK
jgi:hypothetical protein